MTDLAEQKLSISNVIKNSRKLRGKKKKEKKEGKKRERKRI